MRTPDSFFTNNLVDDFLEHFDVTKSKYFNDN